MTHLDLDALADVLAGEPSGPSGEHLAACATCTAALEEMRAALPLVAADLAALPPVPPLPARLTAPVAAPSAAATVLPAGAAEPGGRRRGALVALGGLAAAAVVAVGAVALTSGGTSSSGDTAASTEKRAEVPTSSTGTDYTDATLTAALPALLAGGGPAQGAQPQTMATAADPLAALRTTAGLASCVASLTEPGDTTLPLAVDYAQYRGKPALVVVLPGPKADELDVWVVGPRCRQADADLLHYLKTDRPTG